MSASPFAKTTLSSCLASIHAATAPDKHVGCGVLLDGSFILTCWHVWRDATHHQDSDKHVIVRFPKCAKPQTDIVAKLAFEGEGASTREGPDFVILEPQGQIPPGCSDIQLAITEQREHGAATVFTMILSANKRYEDADFDCRVHSELASRGRRQITSDHNSSYWADRGISGSPVFIENGEQLVGIVVQSEVGALEGRTHLREAYIIAASAIRPPYENFKNGRKPQLEKLIAELVKDNVPEISTKPTTRLV